MIRRSIFLLVVLIALAGLPQGALAQATIFPSTVRSGEHGAFTRLAFRAPENLSWKTRKSGSSVSVTFENTAFRFDLSQVFDRIDTSRLANIAQTAVGDGLELDLACECDLQIFRESRSYVVIDIRETSQTKPRFVLPAITSAGIQYRFGAADPGRSVGSFSDLTVADSGQTPASATAETPEPELPLISKMPEEIEEAFSLPLTVTPEHETRNLDALEGILLGQVGHAANQGLIETTSDLTPDETGRALPAAIGENFSIVTSIDREVMKLGPDGKPLSGETMCKQAADLDVPLWEGDGDIATRIGQLRAEVFKEFDRINKQALVRMAKTYLFYGFGAEAKQTLKLAGDAGPEFQYLIALADIVDGNVPLDRNPFADAHQCPGNTPLWAVLAAGEIGEGTDVASVQRAFSALPSHLRTNLGPGLSNLFVSAGDQAAAELILRAVVRTGAESSPGLDLAEAGIAALSEDHETVQEKLEEAVVSNEAGSAEALVKLVDEHWRSQKPLAPNLPDLAAAYAVEFRDDPLGADLRRAEVIALSLTGSFPEAFGKLQSIRTIDGRSRETEAMGRFLVALTDLADDVTFLRYALGQSGGDAFPVVPEVVLPVADRMLTLGFPGQARDLVEGLAPDHPLGEDGDLLLARSAVALDLPHRAMIDLLGNDSPEANRIRAEALWRNGKIGDAAQLSLQEGNPEAAWRGFWHTGQAQGDPDPDQGRYQRLSALSGQIAEAAEAPAVTTPLAQAQALLQDSAGIREQISELRQQSQP